MLLLNTAFAGGGAFLYVAAGARVEAPVQLLFLSAPGEHESAAFPRVLVVASPTRGLAVAAIETVHRYLREAASGGVGVLLISEDLDEILALADRVAVMYEGRVVGELDAETASIDEIGLLMAGTVPEHEKEVS